MMFWFVCVFCFAVAAHVILGEKQDKFDHQKIAFLFVTPGPMPLEEIWREFFLWKADPNHYSIYIHPRPGYKYPPHSIFYNKEVDDGVEVLHSAFNGGTSLIRATQSLVRAALEDQKNEWFCLMSDSCIPIHSFRVFRHALFHFQPRKSIVNACPMPKQMTEVESRWSESLASTGLTKDKYRKSATWFALVRKHADIFSNESVVAWETAKCSDEHFLPSILALRNLENETTCNDGFVHHVFFYFGVRPHSHRAEEINPGFFQYLNTPIGKGFGKECTGIPGVCHFTARKFSLFTRHILLEHISQILSDDKAAYTKDPFEYRQKYLLRRNGSDYYFIEDSKLRLLPNLFIMNAFHLYPENATELTVDERLRYPMGYPYPHYPEGALIRGKKDSVVHYISQGRRRPIANPETFEIMNLSWSNIWTVPITDVEQTPLGEKIDRTVKSIKI